MSTLTVAQLGGRLRLAGATLAVAESCTGGMLGARLTAVAGSSDWFLGGIISYSNRAKIKLLKVSPCVIETYGAVSEETARAMAFGACRAFHAIYGIGITGIAGPGGATPGKPVGTVCLALAGPCGVRSVKVRFPGNRATVRRAACLKALEMLSAVV